MNNSTLTQLGTTSKGRTHPRKTIIATVAEEDSHQFVWLELDIPCKILKQRQDLNQNVASEIRV